MSFHIENDTPIPPKQSPGARAGKPRKYPWADLEPGQCIVLGDQKEYANATQSARIFKKHNPTFDYVGRRCSDGFYRIWRTVPEAENGNPQAGNTDQADTTPARRNPFSR